MQHEVCNKLSCNAEQTLILYISAGDISLLGARCCHLSQSDADLDIAIVVHNYYTIIALVCIIFISIQPFVDQLD